MHYRPSLLLSAAVTLVAAVFLDAAGTPALWGSCSSPHCCVRRPVSLGPLSGFARRLQSPVETGSRHADAARGHVFSETSLVPPGACTPECPSSSLWGLQLLRIVGDAYCSCKPPGKPPICNYLIISIIVKSSLPGEAKSMPPGRP